MPQSHPSRVLKKANSIPQHNRLRRNHARNRSSASRHVQLFAAGAEGAAGPSTAGSAVMTDELVH
jgi:hypothetical protein